MLLVELLLQSEEVGEAIVEGTFDGCRLHVSPPIAYGAGESPSRLAHACGEGVHASQGVVAVRTGECHLVSCWHLAGTEVVVAAAAQSAEGVVVALEGSDIFLAAHGIVHAADGGV